MSHDQMEAAGIPYWERRWFPIAVMGTLALVYLLNRSPYVGFNDGLSFLYAAETGFDLATNATSHFLYNNLQHVILQVFFFLPSVLVLTLFSIACALGTLGMVYKTGLLLNPSTGLASFTVLVLGLSFTFWQQSEIIEVYAFNNLLFSLFLYAALKDIMGRKSKNLLIVSALLGIGLLTHIQHILSIPFFIVYVGSRKDLGWGRKALGMVPWMACMSLLFFIPALTGLNSWKSVFFESKFQDELLGVDAGTLAKGVLLGLGMLVYNFHLVLLLIASGWRQLWRDQRRLALILMVLALPYLVFALKYSVNDNHVFYLLFHLVLVLPMGLGLDREAWRKRLWWMVPAALVLPIVMYAAATVLAPMVPAGKRYDEDKAYKGGVAHLLWPGKAWARDPLEIAWRHVRLCQNNPEDKINEWNYGAAVNYCTLLCLKDLLPRTWPGVMIHEDFKTPCVFPCE